MAYNQEFNYNDKKYNIHLDMNEWITYEDIDGKKRLDLFDFYPVVKEGDFDDISGQNGRMFCEQINESIISLNSYNINTDDPKKLSRDFIISLKANNDFEVIYDVTKNKKFRIGIGKYLFEFKIDSYSHWSLIIKGHIIGKFDYGINNLEYLKEDDFNDLTFYYY